MTAYTSGYYRHSDKPPAKPPTAKKEIRRILCIPAKICPEQHDSQKINDHYDPVCGSANIMESFHSLPQSKDC